MAYIATRREMSLSEKTASGKSLVLSVRDFDTFRQVKRRYAQLTGLSESSFQISFRDTPMNDDDPLHKHGIATGDLALVSLGRGEGQHFADGHEVRPARLESEATVPHPHHVIAAAATTSYNDETITVRSSRPGYPDLSFSTIRLSCESDPYTRGERNYAGFILYGWEDEEGRMLTDWRLNGKHCRSAYLVVQSTDSPGVTKYREAEAPGVVHGAVYWNVFGTGSEVNKAVGEGFALMSHEYRWNSQTFNARPDCYHDTRREISGLAKKCVRNILDDWRKNSEVGKTYRVKDLLAKD